ncbi:putative transposase [Nonlabens ulvanivorans]|jgi:excisionase family DNA binding protein|nr:helix-turn-helix domain-containing protein [Nonlabens ulvanivorans]GAK89006.1 putative transposase [Nonlabens ulvanivorans]
MAFVAQKTTTKYCGHTCASRAYKQRKREEKVQTALSEQINNSKPTSSENLQTLQTLPTQAGNHINLRDKEFLSITEAADLLGASRWTIQRMIKRNQLSIAKLGRRTIIKRTEIDNLFKI